jgi:hypothetical protein
MKNAVDKTIIRGLYRFWVHIEEPRITGNTGSTHGASTLRIQARKEIRRSDIREYGLGIKDYALYISDTEKEYCKTTSGTVF